MFSKISNILNLKKNLDSLLLNEDALPILKNKKDLIKNGINLDICTLEKKIPIKYFM